MRFESCVSGAYEQLDGGERAPILLELDLLGRLPLGGSLELLGVRLEGLERVGERREVGEPLAPAEVPRDHCGHALQTRHGLVFGVERSQVCLEETVEQTQMLGALFSQDFETEPVFELGSDAREEALVVVVVEQLEPLVREHHDLLDHGAVRALHEFPLVPAEGRLLLFGQVRPLQALRAERIASLESVEITERR